MAAVTICSDFGAPKNKVCHYFHCFPIFCHEVMVPDTMNFVFWMLSFKPAFSLSSFTLIKRLFSSSLLSAIRVVSSAYLRLLIFLSAFLIPACVSSSLAFHLMYFAYKLSRQGWVLKRSEVLIHATTWMNLKNNNIMLSEISLSEKLIYFMILFVWNI